MAVIPPEICQGGAGAPAIGSVLMHIACFGVEIRYGVLIGDFEVPERIQRCYVEVHCFLPFVLCRSALFTLELAKGYTCMKPLRPP